MIPLVLGDFVFNPWGVLAMLLGLWYIHQGYQSKERAGRVAERDPVPVSDLRPGVVEVTGEARTVDDRTVRAHLSDRGALVTEFVLEYDGRTRWRDTHSVPFEVDDGTGTVRVEDAWNASFFYEDHYDRTGLLRGPPQDVQELLESSPEVESFGPMSGDDYRWKTGAIYPGESVYVRGKAVPTDADGGETELVITGDEDDETFLVSDLSESGVVNEYLDEARSRFVIGTFFLVAGLLFTYRPFLALQ